MGAYLALALIDVGNVAGISLAPSHPARQGCEPSLPSPPRIYPFPDGVIKYLPRETGRADFPGKQLALKTSERPQNRQTVPQIEILARGAVRVQAHPRPQLHETHRCLSTLRRFH